MNSIQDIGLDTLKLLDTILNSNTSWSPPDDHQTVTNDHRCHAPINTATIGQQLWVSFARKTWRMVVMETFPFEMTCKNMPSWYTYLIQFFNGVGGLPFTPIPFIFYFILKATNYVDIDCPKCSTSTYRSIVCIKWNR